MITEIRVNGVLTNVNGVERMKLNIVHLLTNSILQTKDGAVLVNIDKISGTHCICKLIGEQTIPNLEEVVSFLKATFHVDSVVFITKLLKEMVCVTVCSGDQSSFRDLSGFSGDSCNMAPTIQGSGMLWRCE